MKTKALLAVPALALAAVTACHPGGTAKTHALATSTAVAQDKQAGEQLLKNAGVPVNGTPAQQIAFVQSLKSSAFRHELVTRLGIPQTKRPAFYAALLGAAEKGHLTTADGRHAFFEATLPQLVEKYQ